MRYAIEVADALDKAHRQGYTETNPKMTPYRAAGGQPAERTTEKFTTEPF